MRALLVNPWIYDFAAYDLWSKPLGLLTIADCLKRSGCEVGLIDCLDRSNPAVKNHRDSAFGCGNYYSVEIEKPAIFKNIPRRYKRYGLPDQPLDEIRDSIEFAASQGVRIFLEEYSPIPGTPDYEKSGLKEGSDPLLHNNSAFSLYDAARYPEFQKIKTWTHAINNNIIKP